MENPSRQQNRIHRKRRRAFWDGLFIQNPVLAGGAGLSLILTGGQSVQLAWVLVLLQLVLLIPVCLLGNVLGKRMFPWLRVPFILLVAAGFYLPAGWAMLPLFSMDMGKLGLCGILTITNTVLVTVGTRTACEKDLATAFAAAFGSGVGFGVVMMIVCGVWGILMSINEEVFQRASVVIGLGTVACLGAVWQYLKNRRTEKQRREWS